MCGTFKIENIKINVVSMALYSSNIISNKNVYLGADKAYAIQYS